ncbi:MAG TPA: hypothetical protein VFJ53_00260 [Solirubrobacterales bacterium]|nr:hypothetical protein [Solirubrobacterales bacterium]
MVEAIENWAELSGTLRDLRPRAGASEMTDLVVAVDAAEDVEGFPNLLSDAPGQELTIAVRNEALPPDPLAPGEKVSLRAQRAAPDVVVAHPESLSRG